MVIRLTRVTHAGRSLRLVAFITLGLSFLACAASDAPEGGTFDPTGIPGSSPGGSTPGAPYGTTPTSAPPSGPVSKAKAITRKLGGNRADRFLVGMGNDGTDSGDDDAYKLGPTLDVHYHYLNGLSSEGGWATWNKNPDYPTKRMREARNKGVVPMFTFYEMAAHGDGNRAPLTDSAFLTTYFKDFSQVLADIAADGKPVILHLEPDFWGYAGQWAKQSGGLSKVTMNISGKAPECAGKPNNVIGFANCLYDMVRGRTPNVILAFHMSAFGTNVDPLLNTDPQFDVVGEARKLAAQGKEMGFTRADLFVVDALDRDAGCYEVGYTVNGEVLCRKESNRYWDDRNVKLPHFNQYFTWLKTLSTELDLPYMIWQIPFGEPSSSPGSPGKWRDNRTAYFFTHMDQIVGTGGMAAVWGTGAPGQSYLTPSFKSGVKAYFASPVALP